jgi:hypothetical protein
MRRYGHILRVRKERIPNKKRKMPQDGDKTSRWEQEVRKDATQKEERT